jgi:hypothetical protein
MEKTTLDVVYNDLMSDYTQVKNDNEHLHIETTTQKSEIEQL